MTIKTQGNKKKTKYYKLIALDIRLVLLLS